MALFVNIEGGCFDVLSFARFFEAVLTDIQTEQDAADFHVTDLICSLLLAPLRRIDDDTLDHAHFYVRQTI